MSTAVKQHGGGAYTDTVCAPRTQANGSVLRIWVTPGKFGPHPAKGRGAGLAFFVLVRRFSPLRRAGRIARSPFPPDPQGSGLKAHIVTLLNAAIAGLQAEGGLPQDAAVPGGIEHTRSQEHGDFA